MPIPVYPADSIVIKQIYCNILVRLNKIKILEFEVESEFVLMPIPVYPADSVVIKQIYCNILVRLNKIKISPYKIK